CWPQKQQCVFTSRSGSPIALQPPGGTWFTCGPNCSTSAETSAGSFAIDPSGKSSPRGGPQAVLVQGQVPAAAGGADILVVGPVRELVLDPERGLDPLQVLDVQLRGERLPAPD